MSGLPDINGIAGFLPVALSALGMFTNLAGASQAASAARVAGQRAQVAAQFEAAQLEQMAGQSIAVSQAEAREQLRQAKLVQSRAIAVAAAGGGGVSDETIVKLIGRQAGEGAYRSAVALYKGEERARQLRLQASAKLYEGGIAIESANARADAYMTSAAGGLATSGATLFSRYGMGGPGATTPENETYKAPGNVLDEGKFTEY